MIAMRIRLIILELKVLSFSFEGKKLYGSEENIKAESEMQKFGLRSSKNSFVTEIEVGKKTI